MARYGIVSVTALERWCRDYRVGGAEALRPKPKGRPKGARSKPKAKPTREQELAEEVAYLRAKVAYLEKCAPCGRRGHEARAERTPYPRRGPGGGPPRRPGVPGGGARRRVPRALARAAQGVVAARRGLPPTVGRPGLLPPVPRVRGRTARSDDGGHVSGANSISPGGVPGPLGWMGVIAGMVPDRVRPA